MKEKKIVMFYNLPKWYNILQIPTNEIPQDFEISTNKYLFKEADIIIFHMHDLHLYVEHDLIKTDNQIWVLWSMECEQNYACLREKEILELFDIKMTYHPNADIACPYYSYDYIEHFSGYKKVTDKEKDICMFISSLINNSFRQDYLIELIQLLHIDSYGKFLNTIQLTSDKGNSTKMEIIKKYKFVIAFENALYPDYVTEKFFDPLLAGTVPIYYGAPNIDEFTPGNNCFIDVRGYKKPKDLADHINSYLNDENLYSSLYAWRKEPLNENFIKKASLVKENPFVRLCKMIQDLTNGG